MRRWVLLWGLLCLGADLPRLSFTAAGQPVVELSVTGAARNLTVRDPHDNAEHTYTAVPLIPLLEKAYGQSWKDGDVLVFTAADGYEAMVDVSEVETGHAWLAYAAATGPFRVENQAQHETAALGPYYLIWEGSEQRSAWPYQVISIDRARLAERYPRVYPPAGASESAHRGFHLFRKRCLVCHSIHGQGGTSAFDLAEPRNVTGYLPSDFIRSFVEDPNRYHGGTRMPGLGTGHPQWLDDLMEYLRSLDR